MSRFVMCIILLGGETKKKKQEESSFIQFFVLYSDMSIRAVAALNEM